MAEVTESLYDQICKAVAGEGLPEGFSLVKPEKSDSGSGLRFAAGAWDGICMYHMNHEPGGEELVNRLAQVLMTCSEGEPEKANSLLENFFHPDEGRAMLRLIDEIQEWILEHKTDIRPDLLYSFSVAQLLHAHNPECVKFALSILELLNIEKDEELCDIIRTLGLSDEFTLFCIFVLQKREDANEQLFSLARKVRGWGRIFIVERLMPETDEIRQWLLKEGWINSVISDYSVLDCAEKGGLAELLEKSSLTKEEFATAGALIKALLPEGPTPGISGLEQKEMILDRYLCFSQEMAHMVEAFEVIQDVLDYLEESDMESRDRLSAKCKEILNTGKCKDVVQSAMIEGKGFELGKKLGLDYAPIVYGRIMEDFRHSYQLIRLLLPDKLYVDELIALFSDKLPLKEMACGPANEMGLGEEWENYRILCYMLQFLKELPGKGETLLLCGLNAPVVNNRNMALNVLEAWKEMQHEISADLEVALNRLKQTEVVEQVKKRLETF